MYIKIGIGDRNKNRIILNERKVRVKGVERMILDFFLVQHKLCIQNITDFPQKVGSLSSRFCEPIVCIKSVNTIKIYFDPGFFQFSQTFTNFSLMIPWL